MNTILIIIASITGLLIIKEVYTAINRYLKKRKLRKELKKFNGWIIENTFYQEPIERLDNVVPGLSTNKEFGVSFKKKPSSVVKLKSTNGVKGGGSKKVTKKPVKKVVKKTTKKVSKNK